MFCQISIKLLLFILKINYTNMEAATKKGPTIVLEVRFYSKFVKISTTQNISYIFIKYIYVATCFLANYYLYIYMLPLVSWPITTYTSHKKKNIKNYLYHSKNKHLRLCKRVLLSICNERVWYLI